MAEATVTSKGQVTIPKSVRDEMGIRPGSRLIFRRNERGEMVMLPGKIDLLSLVGMLRPRRRGVTVEEMNEAIRRRGAGLR